MWSEKTITEEVPLSDEELAEQAEEEADVEKDEDDDDEDDDDEADVSSLLYCITKRFFSTRSKPSTMIFIL